MKFLFFATAVSAALIRRGPADTIRQDIDNISAQVGTLKGWIEGYSPGNDDSLRAAALAVTQALNQAAGDAAAIQGLIDDLSALPLSLSIQNLATSIGAAIDSLIVKKSAFGCHAGEVYQSLTTQAAAATAFENNFSAKLSMASQLIGTTLAAQINGNLQRGIGFYQDSAALTCSTPPIAAPTTTTSVPIVTPTPATSPVAPTTTIPPEAPTSQNVPATPTTTTPPAQQPSPNPPQNNPPANNPPANNPSVNNPPVNNPSTSTPVNSPPINDTPATNPVSSLPATNPVPAAPATNPDANQAAPAPVTNPNAALPATNAAANPANPATPGTQAAAPNPAANSPANNTPSNNINVGVGSPAGTASGSPVVVTPGSASPTTSIYTANGTRYGNTTIFTGGASSSSSATFGFSLVAALAVLLL